MEKYLPRVCVMFIVLAVSSCQFSDKNSNEAETAKILSNPPLSAITDSIRRFPNNPNLYLERGTLLSQRNFHDLASSDYKKAWELNPDETTAISFTSSLFLTGKETEAINLLQQCETKYPQNPEFPRRLGEAYLQSGKTREALEIYNRMIKTDSSDFEAWYQKGALLAQSGDTIQAIRSLEKAFNLQPVQFYGISLANIYAETKNPKALELCDKLLAKDTAGELTDAVFIKGIYYANTNQPDKALDQFEDCIKRDWKYTEAYIEKGIILYKQENIDEALKTFALAAQVSNTYPDAYYWMGRCFESIGKKEEARNNYYRALALDKNFKEADEALNRLK